MSDEEADAAALKQLLADVSETRHELVAMRSWLMAKPEAKESPKTSSKKRWKKADALEELQVPVGVQAEQTEGFQDTLSKLLRVECNKFKGPMVKTHLQHMNRTGNPLYHLDEEHQDTIFATILYTASHMGRGARPACQPRPCSARPLTPALLPLWTLQFAVAADLADGPSGPCFLPFFDDEEPAHGFTKYVHRMAAHADIKRKDIQDNFIGFLAYSAGMVADYGLKTRGKGAGHAMVCASRSRPPCAAPRARPLLRAAPCTRPPCRAAQPSPHAA